MSGVGAVSGGDCQVRGGNFPRRVRDSIMRCCVALARWSAELSIEPIMLLYHCYFSLEPRYKLFSILCCSTTICKIESPPVARKRLSQMLNKNQRTYILRSI